MLPNNNRLANDILNNELLIRLLQAGGGGATAAPLSRLAFVDQGTLQTSHTGSIEFPFSTVLQYLTSIGVGTTAADSTATRAALLISPPSGFYAGGVTIPAFRNVELIGQGFGGPASAVPIVGNFLWANSVAGGGLHAPTGAAQFAMHNIALNGTITYTDDGTVPGVIVLSGDELLEGQSGIIGNITANAGATALADIFLSGVSMTGNIASTNNATGALVQFFNAGFSGAITAKGFAAENSDFTTFALTLPATAAPNFKNCFFGIGSNPTITCGAGSVASFDAPSWLSFREAGGTLVSTVVMIVGGSQAAIVNNTTSMGNQNVTISLNGTGATVAGPFNGALGGNWYVQATAQTGDQSATCVTGGGEKTGDTIDILRTDTAAHQYFVKNNAATVLATFPVSMKGWARVQFNTIIPNDWGLVGGGSGFT